MPFALFAELSPAEFKFIRDAASEKHFSRGETIHSEGDPMRDVTMLLSGFVKVIQMGPNGNEVILRLNGTGEIVGSVCANTHSSTAQAVQPCVALVWEAGMFEEVMRQFPNFRRNNVRALEERRLEMKQRFLEVSSENVWFRVWRLLLRSARRHRN